MKVQDLEAGDGPDTALARALHASGALDLPTLQACLADARAGSRALAELLVERELLDGASLSRVFAEQPASRDGPLHLGEVVEGRYQVTELLGRGGMGAVYGVHELSGRRDLALKVILPEVASEVDLQRFRHEGEIAARLGTGQGFVVVHAAGAHRGLSWFVMERIEGRDLQRALAEGLPLDRLVEVLAQVARSLQACHEQGIVHRDLKPANVLLTTSGPKVADLGLARERDRETLTQTGEVLGTPAYMAPEQLVDARRVDPRTDVYALGAILYRGLAGQPPFAGPLYQVLHAIVSKEPPRPREVAAEAPPELEAVCLRAMAKQPEARYQSALELAEALEDTRGAAAGGGGLTLAWLAGVATLTLLAGAGVAWSARGEREQAAASPSQPEPSPTPRGLGPAEREQLARLLSSDWLDVRLGRAAEAWGRRLTRRYGEAEVSALKREVWREVRPAAEARLRTDADPGGVLRRLGAVLGAPPALSGDLAPLSSAAFPSLEARWLESQEEAAYQAALGLQRARLELGLGEPPLWLQRAAYSRFSDEEGVVDCLVLGVPIRDGLAFANVQRFEDLEGSGDLGQGQLALYFLLSRYDPRSLKKEEQRPELSLIFHEVCELHASLPGRRRDLGRRYVQEIELLGLRAAVGLLTWQKNEGVAVADEARRLQARCAELREQVRYELSYELANVEQGVWLLLDDHAGNVAQWTEALDRIERDRHRPRAGPFWFPDHLRGRTLVRKGLAQLSEEPESVLATCAELQELVPKVEEVARDAGYENFSPRALELDYARLAIDANRRLGHFEVADRLIRAYVRIGSVGENASLGIQAAEVYLAAEDLERAEWAVQILQDAKVREPAALASLNEQLAALRAKLAR